MTMRKRCSGSVLVAKPYRKSPILDPCQHLPVTLLCIIRLQKQQGLFQPVFQPGIFISIIVAELDSVVKRKGKGLMQGLELAVPVAEVNRRCVENGLLVIQAEGNVLRFVPPLIVEEKHIDEMIEKMKKALR